MFHSNGKDFFWNTIKARGKIKKLACFIIAFKVSSLLIDQVYESANHRKKIIKTESVAAKFLKFTLFKFTKDHNKSATIKTLLIGKGKNNVEITPTNKTRNKFDFMVFDSVFKKNSFTVVVIIDAI